MCHQTRGAMVVPPVTALLLLAVILVYIFSPEQRQPPARGIWQMYISWLYHEQELHIVVNWVWALVTCKKLEKVLGSCAFLGILVSLAFLSWAVVAHVFCRLLDDHQNHYMLRCQESYHCLTPVLFSLHFLLITIADDGHVRIGRGHVYHHRLVLVAALSAIALLQAFILHPNAPFLHSLTGILIAFASVYLRRSAFALVHLHPLLIINIILGFFNSNTSSGHLPHYEYQMNSSNHDSLSSSGIGEEEAISHLEWKCQNCNMRNGVFDYKCQACQCPLEMNS